MTRAFLLPGQNYTGPGNSTSRAYRRRHPPTDALDRASLQHDLRYQRLIEREGRFRTYTHFSGADAAYLRRIQHLPGWRAGLARGVFQVKSALVPSMTRSSRSSFRSPAKKRRVGSSRGGSSRSGSRGVPIGGHFPRRPTGDGHYKGRLPKPKRQARPGRVALNGHRLELERYGTAAHANVCYVGAQTAPAAAIGKSVGVAFLRMIMKRHFHLEYSSTSQQLRRLSSGTGAGTSAADANYDYFPQAIKFWRKFNSSAGAAPVLSIGNTYTFPAPNSAGSTVAGFADWFAQFIFLSGDFGGLTGNVGAVDTTELYGYQFVLYDQTGLTSGNFVNQPVMPLEGQYLTAYSVVRMHIQNVTPADDGGLSTDRVDVNPVKGKLMRFRDPTPVIKDERGIDDSGTTNYGYLLQQDINGDGIIWPNPATPPSGPWTQLPTADMFRNCSGMANISLEPGAIKDYSLTFKFSGTIQALMKGFNNSLWISSTTAPLSRTIPSTLNKQFGQSFMFALEKRMPTGNAAVSVNFHYELYVGSCFGGRRKTPMTRQTIEPATAADGTA